MKTLLDATEWLYEQATNAEHDCKNSPDSGCSYCYKLELASSIICIARRDTIKNQGDVFTAIDRQIKAIRHTTEASNLIYESIQKAIRNPLRHG